MLLFDYMMTYTKSLAPAISDMNEMIFLQNLSHNLSFLIHIAQIFSLFVHNLYTLIIEHVYKGL